MKQVNSGADRRRLGAGVQAEVDFGRVLLRVEPDQRAGISAQLKELGLVEETVAARERRINSSGGLAWLHHREGAAIDDATVERLKAVDGAVWVARALRVLPADAGNVVAVAPDSLSILPARGAAEKLDALLGEWGFSLAKYPSPVARRSYVAKDPARADALTAAEALHRDHAELVANVSLRVIPLLSPAAAAPGAETYWNDQWGMRRIEAEEAWDVTKGDAGVYVCVIDLGVPLNHEELSDRVAIHWAHALESPSSAELGPTATAVAAPATTGAAAAHGAHVAGVAAAAFNDVPLNPGFVAGLASACPLAVVRLPDGYAAVDVKNALIAANDATLADKPASQQMVVVLPGADAAWDTPADAAAIQTAIDNLVAAGAVVVVPTGNAAAPEVAFPGQHPQVISVGATTFSDPDAGAADENRWIGSNHGTGLRLVAPGVQTYTLDLAGAAGANTAGPPADLQIFANFEGTSCAAAHVAGAAALLKSRWGAAAMTPARVRKILENSAELIAGPSGSPFTYYDVTRPYFPGGTAAAGHSLRDPWSNQVGFGRLNVRRALDLADVMIRDNQADDGDEPRTGSGGGPDIVVLNDGTRLAGSEGTVAEFDATGTVGVDDYDTLASNYSSANKLDTDTNSFIYVRVRNLGPNTARNVNVSLVLATCAAGFSYPEDFEATGPTPADYVRPIGESAYPAPLNGVTLAADLPAGEERIVKFQIDHTLLAAHVCALARVRADNDYGFEKFDGWIKGSGVLAAEPSVANGQQTYRNNLTQKNLQIVDIPNPAGGGGGAPSPSPAPGSGSSGFWGRLPFFVGSRNTEDEWVHLEIHVGPRRLLADPRKRRELVAVGDLAWLDRRRLERPLIGERVLDKRLYQPELPPVGLRLALDSRDPVLAKLVNLDREARLVRKRAQLDQPRFEAAFEATPIERFIKSIPLFRHWTDERFWTTQRQDPVRDIRVRGGKVVLIRRRRYVELIEPVVLVDLRRPPNRRLEVGLELFDLPRKAEPGDHVEVVVYELDRRGQRLGSNGVLFQVG